METFNSVINLIIVIKELHLVTTCHSEFNIISRVPCLIFMLDLQEMNIVFNFMSVFVGLFFSLDFFLVIILDLHLEFLFIYLNSCSHIFKNVFNFLF